MRRSQERLSRPSLSRSWALRPASPGLSPARALALARRCYGIFGRPNPNELPFLVLTSHHLAVYTISPRSSSDKGDHE
jgi:hypothetical protein